MKKVKEKTYFECLNEISQNKLFKGLLGYGMFAERIPNFLTSKPFYKYCKIIIKIRYSPNARWGISILLTRE
ncbi:hypothetical protein Taiwan43_00830 [Helicobacter pylori]